MTGRHVGAVLGAVLMIVAAVFVRSQLDDDGDGGGAGDGGGELTIACVPELVEVCESLSDVSLVGQDDAEVDALVTFDGLPRDEGSQGEPIRLASTPLVIAMVKERAEVLAPRCGGEITWKCLIDVTDMPWAELGGESLWGSLKVGIPPRTSAIGLLLVAEAVAGYVGTTGFATNDLDFDDAFGPWFVRLKGAAMATDPLGRFVREFPAAFSAAGATEAETSRRLGQRAGDTTVIRPTPVANAVAVLVRADDGDDVDRLADPLREALRDAGWMGAADAPTGLPDPGVLLNLRDR